MPGFSAILDACAIYKANVRDVLFYSYAADLYRMYLTEEIVDEMADALDLRLGENRGLRVATAIRRAFPEAFVENYQGLIRGISLPDDGDRHVLAAAIKAEAHVIITDNVKDFPENIVRDRYGIDVQTCDAFLLNLLHDDTNAVLEIVRKLPQGLTKPILSLQDVVRGLSLQAPQFAHAVGGALDISLP